MSSVAHEAINKLLLGMYICLDLGHVILMDFDGGKFDRRETVTLEHFQTILRYISSTDVTVKALLLVSTFTDRAPESLLYTYCEERQPIGSWVVEWTRAQVTTLKPDLFAVATAKIVRELIDTTDGANYFINRAWGLSQRYDLGEPPQSDPVTKSLES